MAIHYPSCCWTIEVTLSFHSVLSLEISEPKSFWWVLTISSFKLLVWKLKLPFNLIFGALFPGFLAHELPIYIPLNLIVAFEKTRVKVMNNIIVKPSYKNQQWVLKISFTSHEAWLNHKHICQHSSYLVG